MVIHFKVNKYDTWNELFIESKKIDWLLKDCYLLSAYKLDGVFKRNDYLIKLLNKT